VACKGLRLPPDHHEADRQSEVALPLRLLPQPGFVDQPFIHFYKRPADSMSGLHVVAQQVDVAADGDRLARRPGEVRGHTRHQKLGMETHQHEGAATLGDTGYFSAQWPKIGEVFVRQRLHTHLIRLGGQARAHNICDMKRPIDILAPGDLEHFWREVDAIHASGATLLEPLTDPARAARQVKHQSQPRPVDGLQSVEQVQVHLVLHDLLVGAHPFGVPFSHVDNGVSALIVDGVIHGWSFSTLGDCILLTVGRPTLGLKRGGQRARGTSGRWQGHSVSPQPHSSDAAPVV